MRIERRKIKKERILSAGAACLSVIMLLCGCEEQESTKTILLPDETEEAAGFDVKNIQEYTYEGGIMDITWTGDTAGNLCLIKEAENRGIFQRIDVYQKTVSEEIVFEDGMIGYVRIAPGGKYIAYEHPVEENRELILYEVETGRKEAVMTWNIGSSIYTMEWSGDGTRLFVWTDVEETGQNQGDGGERIVYCFDMESESGEKAAGQVRIPVNGRMWKGMFPNEDGSRVFIEEEYYGWEEEGEPSAYVGMTADNGEAAETKNLDQEEVKARNWLVDIEKGEAEEVDIAKMNIRTPVKYTDLGLFGTDENKLWLAREPLGQVSGKHLLEEKYEDIRICDKGDHIFLIEKEENSNYFQVTGIMLEDGEIQEYQVLYKGIYGDFEQTFIEAFIGMEDHELVLRSVEYGEDGQGRLNIKVLEY